MKDSLSVLWNGCSEKLSKNHRKKICLTMPYVFRGPKPAN